MQIVANLQKISSTLLSTGEPVAVITGENCEITAEKSRLEDFQTGSAGSNRSAFLIDVGNMTLDAFTELLLQVWSPGDCCVIDIWIELHFGCAKGACQRIVIIPA